MKLLLVGATGLVGHQVLLKALADTRITQVVAPVRRVLPAHDKLIAPPVNFEQLPQDVDWWQADAVICTLGTTIKVAGSQAAFYRVDHDYPLAAARLAHAHGTGTYVLNSAAGANASSRFFYNRVKGELERDLAGLGFSSLTLVRPGLIGGERDERRPGEWAAQQVLRVLHPLLPLSWRINPAGRIADALLEAALAPSAGVRTITSEHLV
ncbi:NAD-dependent dehydratase [Dickeya dianthicola]|uniref:NAD-dependent dehydratase n=1 Tax=Dickeya dianthicola TaxID=204039 RepID=UPI00136A7EDF|nr:NAD-dependent dehydratase [Dickeya dianthicola]MCI4235888.1 NAD-dependent dehydratase [Dickeya dianthicola]MCI4253861.1 NAD-dependent dehydratase [Dickeya dianthicola]MZG20908.1 NAD-dependent dehydratase [Dickeya dianthicola]MZI89651.1 NAD-dependent dehydratase [Dickeya dianthicola]